MNIIDIWQQQKEKLNSVLLKDEEPADAINHIRHAILQTEQISMAECKDDILRQQMGILFAVIKNSIPLITVSEAGKVWQSVSSTRGEKKVGNRILACIGFGMLALLLAYAVFQREYINCVLSFLCAIAFVIYVIKKCKSAKANNTDYKITLQLNQHQLFSNLDMQFRAADRYMNDFEYLNESLSNTDDHLPDALAIQRSVTLMTALCGLDEEIEDWEIIYNSAQDMLKCFGIKCMKYTAENARYFSILPSKNSSKMLCPALFAIKGDQLLMQGKMVLPNA